MRHTPLSAPPPWVETGLVEARTADIEDRQWQGLTPASAVYDGRSLSRFGRLALSPMVQTSRGTWSTLLMQSGAVEGVSHYLPPRAEWQIGRVILCRIDGTVEVGTVPASTILLPEGIDLAGDRLGVVVGRLRQDAEQAFPRLNASAWRGTTRWLDAVVWMLRHEEHSVWRPRAPFRTLHNTEYTDDFSTDTSASYTALQGGFARDAANEEIDLDASGGNPVIYYNGAEPGDIEHEAQATIIVAAASTNYPGGGAVRLQTAQTDVYFFEQGDTTGDNNVYLSEFVNGFSANLQNSANGIDRSDWVTLRIAAEGAAGANVVLDQWWTDHGGTKPGDPGWIGDDETPDRTFTDTSADRLDAAANSDGGFAGMSGDYDSRLDFFKVRAISDRGGGAPAPPPPAPRLTMLGYGS